MDEGHVGGHGQGSSRKFWNLENRTQQQQHKRELGKDSPKTVDVLRPWKLILE